jgi:cell division protein ZapE
LELIIQLAVFQEVLLQITMIMVENVRAIGAGETNIAIRFINFVDNAYFNRVILFMEVECQLQEIYSQGPRFNEFGRAISRLNEMNSSQYITS